MKKKRMAVMLVGSTLLFGGVLGFVQFREYMIKQFFANMPKPVVSVTAQPAAREQWQDVVAAVGTLSAVNGVDIAPSMAGLVKEIAFQSGQQVRRGQPLLRLDSDVEQGDLRAAQADAELARLSAVRARTLVRSDSVSQAAVDKSEAELKAKEAQVGGLRAKIDKKVIYAPFDGVLGVRKVDLGQYLQPGQAIVNLQDLSVMLVDFSVSQKDLGAVAVGQPVRVATDAWPGKTFDGLVNAVEPHVDARTGQVAVQARVANPDGQLRPGMFARIEVVRPAVAEVVTVPVSAVSYSLYGNAVFVVKGDTAERTVVELGERRDGRVAVLKGLEPGALVVTSGQLKLDAGAKVKVADQDPLRAAKAE